MSGPADIDSPGGAVPALSAEAERAVLAAAVLAEVSPRSWVAELAGVPESAVDEALAAGYLAGSGSVTVADAQAGSRRYAALSPAEQSALHRRAAEVLGKADAAPEVTARHLLAIDPSGDPETTEVLRGAAEAALAAGDATTAAACLDRALREPPRQAARGSLLLLLGAAEFRLGRHAEAAAHYGEGFRLSADPVTRARNLREYAAALVGAQRGHEAVAMLEDEIARFSTEAPDLALAAESLLISFAWFDHTMLDWVRQRLHRYPHPISSHTVGARMLLATETLIDAHHGRRSAVDLAEDALRALDGGRLMHDTGAEYPPYFYAIGVLLLADRGGLARQELEGAIASAERRGARDAATFACSWMALALARDGRLNEAGDYADRCISVAPPGIFKMSPATLGWVLLTYLDQGRYAEAERLLTDTGMDDYDDPLNRTFDPVAFARARLRARRGELEELAVVSTTIRRGSRWNTLDTFKPMILIEPRLVEARAPARELAAELVRDAEFWGTPRALGLALRAQGLLELGEHRIELLDRAVAVLATSPARLELARALVDLGAAVREAGARSVAREPLTRGLALADECGAEPLVALARRELRAAGARTRRTRTHGVDALTPTEARVAHLASDGYTNPEIAAALFVSPKTVETHLTSVYRKLEITTRDQLTTALFRAL